MLTATAQDASADNIRKTFRKLAREYHPDKRKEKDDDEAFKAVCAGVGGGCPWSECVGADQGSARGAHRRDPTSDV